MTPYTPSRIDRTMSQSRRKRKRQLAEEYDFDYHNSHRPTEERFSNEHALEPDEEGDGRIIRKRIDDV